MHAQNISHSFHLHSRCGRRSPKPRTGCPHCPGPVSTCQPHHHHICPDSQACPKLPRQLHVPRVYQAAGACASQWQLCGSSDRRPWTGLQLFVPDPTGGSTGGRVLTRGKSVYSAYIGFIDAKLSEPLTVYKQIFGDLMNKYAYSLSPNLKPYSDLSKEVNRDTIF